MQWKNILSFTKFSSKMTELLIFSLLFNPHSLIFAGYVFSSKSKQSKDNVEKPGETDLLLWFLSHKKAAM